MCVLNRYLNCAKDSAWEESKHHRADNGRFTSGSGRGKSGGKDKESRSGKKDDGESGFKEMSEDEAERHVRAAFKKENCEVKNLRLENRALNAEVAATGQNLCNKVNEHLSKHGLKAKIVDGTTFKIAEDEGDEDEAMTLVGNILVDICAIDMAAKDLHYRAKGKPFYGIHELADVVFGIGEVSDDINEVFYMGEKDANPPDRAVIAAKAAQKAGMAGEDDELIKRLIDLCDDAAKDVEIAKRAGVASGTAALLDEVSKRALQAKGLLVRTLKADTKKRSNNAVINKVIGKGFYIAPEEENEETNNPQTQNSTDQY